MMRELREPSHSWGVRLGQDSDLPSHPTLLDHRATVPQSVQLTGLPSRGLSEPTCKHERMSWDTWQGGAALGILKWG